MLGQPRLAEHGRDAITIDLALVVARGVDQIDAGEHDRLAPPTEIKAVAERIWRASPMPDVRFEQLDGAGDLNI